VVDLSLAEARFWNLHCAKDLSPRQRKAVNALLDAGPGGFEGGRSTRKYENLTGAARATASCDLIELATLGLLSQAGAGRGRQYYLQIGAGRWPDRPPAHSDASDCHRIEAGPV
jgi:Fic family protein